jgi:hypothetical protein
MALSVPIVNGQRYANYDSRIAAAHMFPHSGSAFTNGRYIYEFKDAADLLLIVDTSDGSEM